jgi:SAM-dependent methyltransferase
MNPREERMADAIVAPTETHVSYEKQTVDSPNPLARFAHRARIERSLSVIDDNLGQGGSYADFGAGTGLLLAELEKKRPDATLFGIEPFQTPYLGAKAVYVPDLAALPDSSLDAVSAFEVCEHMYEDEVVEFLNESKRVLAEAGKLILSVPVMYGAAAVPKFVNRVMLYRRNYTGYGFNDLVKSSLGIPIQRPENPRHTHMGFDFRWLMRLVGQKFVVSEVGCSPFRSLPWYFNSQVFIVASPKR